MPGSVEVLLSQRVTRVTLHNAELFNLSWPKEQLLRAKWPEGSRLSASLSSVTENRRLAVR